VKQLIRRCLLLLVLVAGFARNGFRKPRSGEVRRVLLIRPDHLGDALFMTPALAELRRALPEAHITVLVGPWAREVVARNPNIDEVQICAFPGLRRSSQSAFEPYRLLWQLAGQLRRQQYDLAVVLRPDFWWGVWLTYLAGIPLRLGYADALQTSFLTLALPAHEHDHAVVQNLRLAQAAIALAKGEQPNQQYTVSELASGMPGQPPLEFAPTDEERAWIQKRLAQAGITDTALLVVIHPGSGAAVKLWEPTSWAKVADVLIREHGAQVVLTGVESEREQVEGISAQMREQALVLVGETDVGTLAALLARANVVLGVDNGPLHLATAQGTPTARIYGPTDTRIFGPWGAPALHIVLQAKQPCPGCPMIPCGRLDWPPEALPAHPCVRSIPVEEMLAVAGRLLEQHKLRQATNARKA
jgi:lipopolysaccharide heptosyltransferase II